MRQQPMIVAFVVAAVGAIAIGMRPGAESSSWAPLLVGVALAAATTGIVGTFMQFLPNRLFGPFTFLAGAIVATAVFVLLRATEYMGFVGLPAYSAGLWGAAAIVALVVSRESGLRLPPLRKSRAR